MAEIVYRISQNWDSFVICLDHQSFPRLDIFGISAGNVQDKVDSKARERIKGVDKEVWLINQQEIREEIFREAVFQEILERAES
jgi:hypothetical protein